LRTGTWEFEVFDKEKNDLGSIVLYFSATATATATDLAPCKDGYWWRADVVSEDLEYKFGFDLKPAYRLHGPWLTVDLTSTTCSADYLLNGEMNGETAQGFFNYSHKLGGDNIGKFIALPYRSMSEPGDNTSLKY
jgi:hypothetical protein